MVQKEKSGIYLDSLIAPQEFTPEQTRRAQLIVAAHSVGVEECAEFLDMLGLNLGVDNNS